MLLVPMTILLIGVGIFLFPQKESNIFYYQLVDVSEKKEAGQLLREDIKEEPESKEQEIFDQGQKEVSLGKEDISFVPFFRIKLQEPPEIVRAIYLTAWSAGSPRYFNYLINLLEITEINAVVIDIKDYSGFVSYPADVEIVKKYGLTNNAIRDIDSLINFLHQKGIYVIGRITVFQDPALASKRPDLALYDVEETKRTGSLVLWQDRKNLFWLDPSSFEVWEYHLALARDAFLRGFDEVNFDYIRFPSDGNLKNIGYPFYDLQRPRRVIIREFFQYLRQELPNERISADLFGLTTVNRDDLGVGQVIEDAFEFFDFVCPMLYPSHYASGFRGFENPAEFPYEVVSYSLESALARKKEFEKRMQEKIGEKIFFSKIRPWLQDFDLGADYTDEMVRKEIQAVKDVLGAEFVGYILWNPSNLYSHGAIIKNR